MDELSFKINEGEIVGLLGPNGAGKTTTTQALLGCLTPTSGEIWYFGKKMTQKDPKIMEKTNFASAYAHLPRRMKVWENLDVYAQLYGVKERKKRIDTLVKAFEIEELKNKQVMSLSAGQNTRVVLAKAFINWPRLLLLDEPTASLDPDIAAKVRRFLVKQRDQYGAAMLFTSHNMKEVEEICDRVIFLHQGKKIAQGKPSELAQKIEKVFIKLRVVKGKFLAEKYLEEKKINFSWKDQFLKIEVTEDDIAKILYRLSQKGVRYQNLEVVRPSLEDFFIKVAGSKK